MYNLLVILGVMMASGGGLSMVPCAENNNAMGILGVVFLVTGGIGLAAWAASRAKGSASK